MGSSAGKQKQTQNYTRKAHHAGSWYEGDDEGLRATLERHLHQAELEFDATGPVRAVIVPHAGYRFSGPTAAYAYKALGQSLQNNAGQIRTIVVFHPSHHVYLTGCAVSGADRLKTPVGDLIVDHALRQEILSLSAATTTTTTAFSVMDQSMDEHEHSGELQYPFLAHLLRQHDAQTIRVLPIMCGALDRDLEVAYGACLRPILARPEVCTVVSSDFCHWGHRFRYQPTNNLEEKAMPIFEFIQRLDRQGMDLIEMKRPGAFADYLRETRNTICGRHAIAVWLNAAAEDPNLSVQFVKYAQSSAVKSRRESSVSYGAAVATRSS